MAIRLHAFGASGSGTTTLGRRIAEKIGGEHLDTDDYYWRDTDPPFVTKRDPEERVRLILNDTKDIENWVLSGSICSWGALLLNSFSLAVFVFLDTEARMNRLERRESEKYGRRILPGGDMYVQHTEFIEWARSYDSAEPPTRSLQLHENWMRKLTCPVIRVNSSDPVDALVEAILAALDP